MNLVASLISVIFGIIIGVLASSPQENDTVVISGCPDAGYYYDASGGTIE